MVSWALRVAVVVMGFLLHEDSAYAIGLSSRRCPTMTDIAVAVLERKGTYRAVYTVRFAEAIAEELQVKAGLTHQISNRIQALGLTQVQAGERLGIGQPDVSKLMNGRYTGYSTDRLIALLNALDVDVEIVVHPRSESESPRRGSVRVMKLSRRSKLLLLP